MRLDRSIAGIVLGLFLVVSGCGNSSTGAANDPKGHASTHAQVSPTPAAKASVQTVKIESADKAIIVGSYYPAAKLGSPALLLMHQWNSNRHDYDKYADHVNAKGYAVLSIDGRGFGESTKTADGRTISPERTDAAVKAMLGDVDAAFEFLAKQANVDAKRIGIVGGSYGSSLAILYAADHPSVKAVALLSPGVNYFGNMATEPAVEAYGDRPLLLVAAEDDKQSADSVAALKKVSDVPSHEAVVYPKGGHATAIFNAGVGLQDRLDEFFDKTL